MNSLAKIGCLIEYDRMIPSIVDNHKDSNNKLNNVVNKVVIAIAKIAIVMQTGIYALHIQ